MAFADMQMSSQMATALARIDAGGSPSDALGEAITNVRAGAVAELEAVGGAIRAEIQGMLDSGNVDEHRLVLLKSLYAAVKRRQEKIEARLLYMMWLFLGIPMPGSVASQLGGAGIAVGTFEIDRGAPKVGHDSSLTIGMSPLMLTYGEGVAMGRAGGADTDADERQSSDGRPK